MDKGTMIQWVESGKEQARHSVLAKSTLPTITVPIINYLIPLPTLSSIVKRKSKYN